MLQISQQQAILFLSGAFLAVSFASLLMASRSRREATLQQRMKLVELATRPTQEDKKSTLPEVLTGVAACGLSEAEQQSIFDLMRSVAFEPRTLLLLFTAARVLATGAGMIAVWLVLGATDLSPFLSLALAAFAGMMIWLLIVKFLAGSVKAQGRKISRGLPDALELLAVCTEAGYALEQGLKRVASEISYSNPPLGRELSRTWAEMTILPDREQALLNLASRVDLAEVRSLVTTLVQTMRYGTPLAQSLRTTAAEARAQQLAALEEKASKLPAMLTLPVMLFLMPTIFLIVGGPALIRVLDMLAAPG